MKILITGGAGYIGSHMVLELIKQNHEVVVLDNLSKSNLHNINLVEKQYNKKIEFIKRDITQSLDNIKVNDVDAIVHFAAFKAVGESVEKPNMYYENNVWGSVNLIKFAIKNNIKNFVFSSTCAVYGNTENPVVNEETQVNPISPYGTSKSFVEKILEDNNKSSSLNVVVLRYFNVAGNSENPLIGDLDPNPQTLIPSIMLSHLGKRKMNFKVFGDDYPTRDGTCIRDYIHVTDLVKGHIKALEFLGKNTNTFNVFNLGTGNGATVKEIINVFEKVTGENLKYEIVDKRPGDAISITSDTTKAKNLLEWEAQHSLEDMITSMWKWYNK